MYIPQNVIITSVRFEHIPAAKVDDVRALIDKITEDESPSGEASPMTHGDDPFWGITVDFPGYKVADTAAWCQVLRDVVMAEVYASVNEEDLAQITLIATACTDGSTTPNITLTIGADAQLRAEAIPSA